MTSVIPTNFEFPSERTPQDDIGLELPPNTTVVSADSHFTLSENIFVENFPERIKSKAPDVWLEDGTWHIGFDGRSLLPRGHQSVIARFDPVPGCTNLEPRLRDLAHEGIEKEIVFGSAIHVVTRLPDFEAREWGTRIYNRYMADLAERAPKRFYPVAYGNFWDPSSAGREMKELVDLGFKVLSIPQFPGADADGKPINYAWPEMEPFWAALEDSGLTLAFHVGESVSEGPGGVGTSTLASLGPMRKVFGDLVFGGILARHPKLKVVFTEAGIAWIASALYDAEMIFDSFSSLLDPTLPERPTHYWQTNCYATFITDDPGLRLLDLIGADRVMWGHDYPHLESAFGYGWSAMERILAASTPEQARMILGQTAIDAYGLG